MGRSLHARLLWLVGITLVSVWLGLGWWLYGTVQDRVGQALDQRLAASARMVASMASAGNGLFQDPQALRSAVEQGLSCQVMNLRGEILARSGGAPAAALAGPQDGFDERFLEGEAWRIYTFSQGDVRVATAEPMALRGSLLQELSLALLLGVIVALLVALAGTGWAVRRALAPLELLRRQFEQQPVREPLAETAVMTELMPLMAALQGWAKQAREALLREQRLTDDLAHELRTPLAAIKTQLQVARIKMADSDAQGPLRSAEQACTRMAESLQQLLALARLDGLPISEAVPVSQVVQDSIAQLNGVWQKAGVQCVVSGHSERSLPAPELSGLALRNLLENALRYSPAGGTVTVDIEDSAQHLRLSVLDAGPGIEGDPRAYVARGGRGDQGQSGLGLAIVATVMARSRGRLLLRNRPQGGLAATLEWDVTRIV